MSADHGHGHDNHGHGSHGPSGGLSMFMDFGSHMISACSCVSGAFRGAIDALLGGGDGHGHHDDHDHH